MEIQFTFKDRSSSYIKLDIPALYRKGNLPIMYKIEYDNVVYLNSTENNPSMISHREVANDHAILDSIEKLIEVNHKVLGILDNIEINSSNNEGQIGVICDLTNGINEESEINSIFTEKPIGEVEIDHDAIKVDIIHNVHKREDTAGNIGDFISGYTVEDKAGEIDVGDIFVGQAEDIMVNLLSDSKKAILTKEKTGILYDSFTGEEGIDSKDCYIEKLLNCDGIIQRESIYDENNYLANKDVDNSSVLESKMMNGVYFDEYDLLFNMDLNLNKYDKIDIPNTDRIYKLAKLKMYDENGVPNIPVDINNIGQERVRVNLPNINYNQIDIGNVTVNVKIEILRKVVLEMCRLKRAFSWVIAAIDPIDAINYMLEKLLEYINKEIESVNENVKLEYYRSFRFVRWYGETLINKYSQFWLIRSYKSYVAPLYKNSIDKIDYIIENDGFVNKNFVLANNKVDAIMELEFNTYIDADMDIVINVLNNSIDLPSIDIDNEVIPLSLGINTINKALKAKAKHKMIVSTKNSMLNISTLKIGGTKFMNAKTEYINSGVDGLLMVRELNLMLIKYFSLHHERKTKSNINKLAKN